MKSIILFLACTLPFSAFAHKVIGIFDGDTLTLLVNEKPLKIRLANIDAPEKAQAFGERSKQALSDLCFGKDAEFLTQDVDRYGRAVAIVTCSGVEANRWQVEHGMAWIYTKYNKDASLPYLENTARTERRGLWSEAEPLAPWEFRMKKKEVTELQ